MKTTWSYLSWGAKKAAEKAEEHKLGEKLSSAATTVKNKANEHGIPGMAEKAAKGIVNGAVTAGTYTVKSGKSIYNSA